MDLAARMRGGGGGGGRIDPSARLARTFRGAAACKPFDAHRAPPPHAAAGRYYELGDVIARDRPGAGGPAAEGAAAAASAAATTPRDLKGEPRAVDAAAVPLPTREPLHAPTALRRVAEAEASLSATSGALASATSRRARENVRSAFSLSSFSPLEERSPSR